MREARVAALGANTPEWLSARKTANPRGGNAGLRIGKPAVVERELAKIKRRVFPCLPV